jgi:Flp pilus assembly CpaF family ATPase
MALRDLTQATPPAPIIEAVTVEPTPVAAAESPESLTVEAPAQVAENVAQRPAAPVAVVTVTQSALTHDDLNVIEALKARIFDLNCNEIRLVGQDQTSANEYFSFLGIGTRYYEASEEILIKDEAQMRRILNHFILPNTSNDALDGSQIGVYTKGGFFLREGVEERTARIQIFLPPVTPRVSINFQLLSKTEMDLEDLVNQGTMDLNMAAYLKYATLAGASVVFSGIPGSGKSTIMGAAVQEIPNVDPTGHVPFDPNVVPEFVLCMQEMDEIPMSRVLYKQKFYSFEEAVSMLKGRDDNFSGSMSDLVDIAKVARGYRAIFGECRGPEMYDYLEASSIFAGCMTTLHAKSAQQAVANAVQFAMRNPNAGVAGLEGVRRLVAGGIDLVVHMEKLSDDRRVVSEIVELDGSMTEGDIRTQRLFAYNHFSGVWERPAGSGMTERDGRLLSLLEAHGLPNLHANPIA